MDKISEMFTQIRNAQDAGKENLEVPFSKLKMTILEVLKNHQKIADFKKISEAKTKEKIEIKLFGSDFRAMRISKPGRRVYSNRIDIPRPKSFKGLIIISTPEGMMIGEEARKKGLGGELIAEIS